MPEVFEQLCGICGARATRIEIVKPNEVPEAFAKWSKEEQSSFMESHDPNCFLLIYNGIESGTGPRGTVIQSKEAAATIKAFSNPPTKEFVRAADFFDNAGLCLDCNEFYCYKHWNPSSSGYGTCPRGHGASLDPHWSPDYDF